MYIFIIIFCRSLLQRKSIGTQYNLYSFKNQIYVTMKSREHRHYSDFGELKSKSYHELGVVLEESLNLLTVFILEEMMPKRSRGADEVRGAQAALERPVRDNCSNFMVYGVISIVRNGRSISLLCILSGW